MKSQTLSSLLMVGALATSANAATLTVNPTDITFVSVSTTTTDPGTVQRGNSDQFEVRTRTESQVTGGDTRTVATFANFDISTIPTGSTIDSATLSGTYDSQLNNVNSSDPATVGAVTQAWDTSGTANPLFTYGEDYSGLGLDAINNQVLVSDIKGTAATGQAVSADFTSTVQAWLDGVLDNNGLVFYIDGYGAQGAGFNNVSLEINYTVVPEPSSALLLLSGLGGLVIRRRR